MKVVPATAYCMNLDSREDRLEQVTKDFTRLQQQLPITLKRVSAVLNKEQPARGVRETFKKIIRKAKAKNLAWVLIIEDDLFVIDPVMVANALMNAPNNWDILSGGVYYHVPYYTGEPKLVNGYWQRLLDFCSLHFIIVRDTAYDKILKLDSDRHLDRELGSLTRAGKLRSYVIYPMPCQQRPGYSNIRKKNVNDNRARKLPWVDSKDTLQF